MTDDNKNREETSYEIREYHTRSSGIFLKVKNFLHKSKSKYQEIEVVENEYFGKVLFLDGLLQTTEKDEYFYHEMLAHPALITHPFPQNILVIGGGDGGLLKEILPYSIKYACLVEIDREVVEVSQKYFPWLKSCLRDQRTELIFSDGREFIEKTTKKFDIVFIDSSDPVGPSANLHESDFYEKLKKCLSPGGIVVAQVGSPFYKAESIYEKNDFLMKLFKMVCFYVSPVPTYPGGYWCFVFLSDEIKPFDIKRNPPEELKYFNLHIHRAAFSLPNFLRDKLESQDLLD